MSFTSPFSTKIKPIIAFSLVGFTACSAPYELGQLNAMAEVRTDKAEAGHGFTDIYERFFFPMKKHPVRICEIGIAEGGSLELWKKYFPKAEVFGIDIADKSHYASGRVHTYVADQADREQLQGFINQHGHGFDIILDDGGHSMEQQQISLGFFFPHLKPGGYYIIEDVHTSLPFYYPGFGVEPDGKNTTLQMIQHFNQTGIMRSAYLEPQETYYLTDHIDYSVLFFRNGERPSMSCILKKKQL